MRIRQPVALGLATARHRVAVGATAAVAVLASLAFLGSASPALAQPSAGPVHGGPGGPTPPGGAQFWHMVDSNVSITGDTMPGQAVNYPLSVPPCWLEAKFTAGDSWRKGDPLAPPPQGVDADNFWWWFADQYPGFPGIPSHNPGANSAINLAFKHVQQQNNGGSWWAPAWLSGPAGQSCAASLVSSLELNNGFLDRTKPGATPPGAINARMLADLARAALALPVIKVFTNPKEGNPKEGSLSDVNLPVWVWVKYYGEPANPQDTASVPLPGGGTLSATVATSRPQVSLKVSDPSSATLYNHCGSNGSQYPGDPAAIPPCGVTFNAPSTGGPFTLTVTATWTVSWKATNGQAGGFATPPWPLPMAKQLQLVTVREIQSVNNG